MESVKMNNEQICYLSDETNMCYFFRGFCEVIDKN